MDMDDDDDNLFDDFDVENDDMLRLLESGENQYRSSQMPQEDLPMPTLNQELQMSAIEEPNVVDLATTSNAGYNPHGMQVIEDDLNFDLQRQGYSSYSSTRANENIMNELINLKKEDKVKDHKIESLKLEIIKWKNLSRREDTPMRDISDTKSQIDSKIFPNTNGFSVKRIDYEGRSTSSRYNRPIKKLMSTHKVIPAPIQRQPSLMSSQRTDVSMQSTPAPVTIDHKKIERQNKLLAILLGDSFLKWRRNTHIQIGTDLTQTHLNELCQLEAKKLLPTKTCNPDSHRRLTLVHNDYIDSLSNYDCDGILQKLLNIFRLSLSIALKENQNTIIVYIVSKIKLLVETFAETVDILYNEFNRMDTTSTLFFVGMSLSLFYADVNPAVSKNLKYHLPDLSQLTLMELTTITNDYSIKPDIISKVVKERIKPEAAKNGVLSILQIIITISKKVRQSLFGWLLNDASFIELLSNSMPESVIFNTLSVIDTYTEDTFVIAFKNEKEVSLIKKMIDLALSPPWHMSYDKIIPLKERLVNSLNRILKSALPLPVFNHLYQEIIPVLVKSIKNEISDTLPHEHPFFTHNREKSVLSSIFLLGCLSEYSAYDNKYPPSILIEFVNKVFEAFSESSGQYTRQIKEQIRNINTKLNKNAIMIE